MVAADKAISCLPPVPDQYGACEQEEVEEGLEVLHCLLRYVGTASVAVFVGGLWRSGQGG